MLASRTVVCSFFLMRFSTCLSAGILLAFLVLVPSAQAQHDVPGFANPSCESGGMPPAGWTATGEGDYQCDMAAESFCAIPTHSGTNAFITNSPSLLGERVGMTQIVAPIEGADLPGKTVAYTVRAQDCAANVSDTGTLTLAFLDQEGQQLDALSATCVSTFGAWSTCTVAGVAPAATTQLQVAASCTETADGSFCDIVYDTMTLTTDAPLLPVELVSFDALGSGTDIVLQWETASETNNAGFEVQQQTDFAWRTIAFVPGRGTTAEAQTYTHQVPGLMPGAYRFRLKQMDFDGTASYSPVVEATVSLNTELAVAPATPNPFRQTTTLRFAVQTTQLLEAGLFDLLGRRVRTLFSGVAEADVLHTLHVDARDLPEGIYVVRLRTADGHQATQRLVRAR